MAKKLSVIAAAAVLALTLAACGGGSSGGSTHTSGGITETTEAGATELVIKASNFEFDQEEYVVKQGEPVTIVLENVQGVHGVNIGGEIKLVDGKPKTVTFDKPGEYQIACSIPCGVGHVKMVSKLIVQ
ncbi:cytochrome C oxidase subunit II [Paenibacillus sambharensis]|uniref:Cytochrome C oxidase subunit II n=1 Tax=Paenibacillus sambharensis TaxID=1803190 RepID=A0A2W1LJK0_9BACL|nr:cytochrome C oxidase subunit II [Paenibacillus sambharensis]PZD95085.1 cytochrome C oxidase subunit II [Paenibacillus sambharensis]